MAQSTENHCNDCGLSFESNKRPHREHEKSSTISSTNKAQLHSWGDTPQQSQLVYTAGQRSESDQETKDRVPSLTGESASSSSGGDKSESPEEENTDAPTLQDRIDRRVPITGNMFYQVNLRYDGQNTDIPVLPSLGKDSLVQEAFSHDKILNIRPHDGRYHGLNSSVYKEDQAWRLNPSSIHKFQDQVNEVIKHPPDSGNDTDSSKLVSDDAIKGVGSTPTSTADNVAVSVAERPFSCTFENCNWSFLRSSDQKRHIRSHNKPLLRCPYWELDQSCHRNSGAFNRRDVLKRHLKLMHYDQGVGTDQGQCKHCKLYFNNVKQFYEHCDVCSVELLSLSKLNIGGTGAQKSPDEVGNYPVAEV